MIAPSPPAPAPSPGLRALVLALPFLVLGAWIAAVTLHASLSLDGIRHFYLDDSQMVSMRYARNLVEGQGLVWNPGERVEGYSNFGWVLAMAAVHAAGASAATASLYVKLIAALCAAGVLWWALVLRRLLGRTTLMGELVLLLALALNADVVFWAANGFETTLLAALLLWVLVRVVRETGAGGVTAPTMIAAGVLPVVRADAHFLTLAVAAIAVALSIPLRRSRAARLAILALVVPLLHLAFRLAYYGDALPNTFHLRHAGDDDVVRNGVRYLRAFVLNYWPLAGVALAGAFTSGDRRQQWLLAAIAAAAAQALAAGGDIFAHFRVLAPVVPLIVVLAVAAVEDWTAGAPRVRAGLLAATAGTAIWCGGMLRPWPVDALRSWRGKPWQGVVIGRLIDRHSAPGATVAAVETGALGYFSRRRVIDLAGRTDPAVARLSARPGADGAARKFDIARSLSAAPDFVLSGGRHDAARYGEIMFALSGIDPERDVGPAILADRTFLRDYRDFPVPLQPLLDRSAVYVRRDSPERRNLGAWRMPVTDF